METIHSLKVLPEYFAALADRRKTFEIRYNDRDYGVGDVLVLREYNPKTQDYTGRSLVRDVTYVLKDEKFLQPGYVALGLSCFTEDLK